jgi:hypothetical protein
MNIENFGQSVNINKSDFNNSWMSARGCCPVCGQHNSWSLPRVEDSANPSRVICYGNHAPLPGWKYLVDTSTGGRLYVRENSLPYNKFQYNETIFSTETCDEQVAPEKLDRVYRALFEMFDARHQPKYRKQLQRRGFTNVALHDQPIGYLPGSRGRIGIVKQLCKKMNLNPDELRGIPGFFFNGKYGMWSLAGSGGLMLPVKDHNGHIVGIQIKPDHSRGDAKYIWLSSGHQAENGGTSSGAPAGVFLPLDSSHHSGDTVYLVEGYFKALALRREVDAPIVWLAGVGMINSAIERLQFFNAKKVAIFFDADWRAKYQVRKALVGLAQKITEKLGYQVEAFAWPSRYGKGIDDALLLGNLDFKQVQAIDLEQLTRGVENERYLHSDRFICDPQKELSWEPHSPPTIDELRAITARAIEQSLSLSPGTIALMMAGTNTSKTYSSLLQAPKRSIFVFNNYSALYESLDVLRGLGRDVQVYYGRQAPPDQPPGNEATDDQLDGYEQKLDRWRQAGCMRYNEARQAGNALHNPCEGCPFFEAFKLPLFHQQTEQYCCYWPQRQRIEDSPPPYLLMVAQTFTSHPDILRHYDRVFLDDVPQFVQLLANRINLSREDILNWYQHPAAATSSPSELQAFLLALLNAFNHREQATYRELKEKAELALRVVTLQLKESESHDLPCESIFNRDGAVVYPHRLLVPLLRKIAYSDHYKITEHNLSFLLPAQQILDQLLQKLTIVLDATPNLVIWRWLAQCGFKLHIPELPRRFPPIYQVFDLLHTKQQLEKNTPFIEQLLNAMGRDKTLVFTFKPPDGKDYPFDAVGHFGRDDRGLNRYGQRDIEQMVILGHYQIPTNDAAELAWTYRTLAKELNISPPQIPFQEEEPEEGKNGVWRFYQDSLRPYGRRCWRSHDPLAEHLRRHHHSSAAVQFSNRPRDFNVPTYLFSGEPLDGLPYEVPVQLISMAELADRFGIAPPKHNRQLSSALSQYNELRQREAEQRIEKGVQKLLPWMNEHQRFPTQTEIQRLLADDDRRLLNAGLAKRILERLHGGCPKNFGLNYEEKQGYNGHTHDIETALTHTIIKEETNCVCYPPNLKGAEPHERLEYQGSERPQIWDKPPSRDDLAMIWDEGKSNKEPVWGGLDLITDAQEWLKRWEKENGCDVKLWQRLEEELEVEELLLIHDDLLQHQQHRYQQAKKEEEREFWPLE